MQPPLRHKSTAGLRRAMTLLRTRRARTSPQRSLRGHEVGRRPGLRSTPTGSLKSHRVPIPRNC